MSVTVPHVATIAELRRRAGLAPPRRPLLSVARIEEVPVLPEGYPAELTYGFYTLTLKRGDFDRACYGAGRHDFAAGVLQAHAPRQRVGYPRDYGVGLAGWVLAWHPDLLHDHALAARLPAYGFFRYRREEALHLSDEELDSLWEGFAALQREYRRPVDVHSKRILVACLELLLTYADRFYRRQFVTRHEADSSLAARFRAALERRLAAPGGGFAERRRVGRGAPRHARLPERPPAGADGAGGGGPHPRRADRAGAGAARGHRCDGGGGGVRVGVCVPAVLQSVVSGAGGGVAVGVAAAGAGLAIGLTHDRRNERDPSHRRGASKAMSRSRRVSGRQGEGRGGSPSLGKRRARRTRGRLHGRSRPCGGLSAPLPLWGLTRHPCGVHHREAARVGPA